MTPLLRNMLLQVCFDHFIEIITTKSNKVEHFYSFYMVADPIKCNSINVSVKCINVYKKSYFLWCNLEWNDGADTCCNSYMRSFWESTICHEQHWKFETQHDLTESAKSHVKYELKLPISWNQISFRKNPFTPCQVV